MKINLTPMLGAIVILFMILFLGVDISEQGLMTIGLLYIVSEICFENRKTILEASDVLVYGKEKASLIQEKRASKTSIKRRSVD